MTTSVWSASDAATNGMTLSNGGLTLASPSGGWSSVRTTISKTSGKLYVEFLCNVAPTGEVIIFGSANSTFNPVGYIGQTNYSGGSAMNGFNLASTGFTDTGNHIAANIPALNDVLAMAIDFGSGNIWYAQNNSWYGSPTAGTGSNITFVPATVGALFAAISLQAAMGTWTLQTTPANQKYTPPAGFSAWDTLTTSTWSGPDAAANAMTLSNGGLTAAYGAATGWNTIRGSKSLSSGKVYFELLNTATPSNIAVALGMADNGAGIATTYLSANPISMGAFGNVTQAGTSGIVFNYGMTGFGLVNGDVFGIAVDLTSGKLWIARNNVWFGGGNPGTGTSPMATISSPALGASFFPALTLEDNLSGVWTLQPTAVSQKYAPPSGFSAWDASAVVKSAQARVLVMA
jgi:hypothetical protein